MITKLDEYSLGMILPIMFYNNDLLVEEISYIGSKGPFRLN